MKRRRKKLTRNEKKLNEKNYYKIIELIAIDHTLSPTCVLSTDIKCLLAREPATYGAMRREKRKVKDEKKQKKEVICEVITKQ